MTVHDPITRNIRENIEDTGWGGYLVRREFFDRELARLAILSGAKLFLNVRAESLIRKDNQVVGAITSSHRLPEVRASVTICADGMRSATAKGFARSEIASENEAEVYPGVQMELINVHDVKPGEIEMYETEDQMLRGRSLWPHARGVTLASFSSIDVFQQLKSREDNLFSEKIGPSFPIYISSFQNRKNMGFFYSQLAKDGVIYVGEASGCSGIVHGMISAHYGVYVAKMAIQSGDTSMRTIGEYGNMIKNSDIYRTPFCYRHIRSHYGSYKEWLERSKEIRV